MAIVAKPNRQPGKMPNNVKPAPLDGIEIDALPQVQLPRLTAEEISKMTPKEIAEYYCKRKNGRRK